MARFSNNLCQPKPYSIRIY